MGQDLIIVQIKLDGFPVLRQLLSEEEAAAEIRAVETLVRCEMATLEWYTTTKLFQEVV